MCELESQWRRRFFFGLPQSIFQFPDQSQSLLLHSRSLITQATDKTDFFWWKIIVCFPRGRMKQFEISTSNKNSFCLLRFSLVFLHFAIIIAARFFFLLHYDSIVNNYSNVCLVLRPYHYRPEKIFFSLLFSYFLFA